MKKLLLFLLFQGSLDCYTQTVQDSTFKKVSLRPDTVRASLLRTVGKMTIAHNYEGHAVINGSKVVEFLDDRKRRFPVQVIVWNYIIKN